MIYNFAVLYIEIMNKDCDLIQLHDRCSLLEFIENEEYKLKSSSVRIKKLRAVYELKPLPQIVQKVKPDDDIEKSYTSPNDIDESDVDNSLQMKKPNVLKRLYSSCKKYSIKKNIQKSEEYHEYLIYDEDFDNCFDYKLGKNMWYNSLFK